MVLQLLHRGYSWLSLPGGNHGGRALHGGRGVCLTAAACHVPSSGGGDACPAACGGLRAGGHIPSERSSQCWQGKQLLLAWPSEPRCLSLHARAWASSPAWLCGCGIN